MGKKTSTIEAEEKIAQATKDAGTLLAKQAEDAIKVIAAAAAEALKVQNVKTEGDHDLIIKLDTKMDALSVDIKDLKEGTAERIANLELQKLNIQDSYPVLYKAGVEKMFDDHENRIRINTGRITQIMTWGAALMVMLGIAEFIISRLWH